jgi:hypothetical protein
VGPDFVKPDAKLNKVNKDWAEKDNAALAASAGKASMTPR